MPVGRTNPTFRDLLRKHREDWQSYRRGLRATHKPAFDALFEDAATHADAAGLQNAREPMFPILVSMLLAQKRQIRTLEDRVEVLENQVDADDGRPED
ncbi:hypothetical protein ACKVMT_02355 [Halobacteriales archaeon Cl-PHB]